MSRGSMARSSMISPMTCPLFTLISRESSRSISSTRKTETWWANKHWVPDPKIQFEQHTMKGTVQMNLQSHTSVLNKLEVPNVNLENSAFTSLFSFEFESQSLSKTIDIYAVSYDSRSKQMHSDAHNQILFNKTVYRRFWPEGPNGTKIGLRSNVIRSILYVSAKWSFLYADVAATKTRSRRVYPFGIRSPPVISSRSSAGMSREYT